MNEIKNDFIESRSSNLLFLRENFFQDDLVNVLHQNITLNFENTLFLLAHCKIVVIFWERNKYLGLNVIKIGLSVEC